jgi:tetratricopeptide (TPR) repeat protein
MQPYKMPSNSNKLVFLLLLLTTLIPRAYAETQEDTQALFDEAVQKRDSGKIYEAIKLFETLLSTRPQLGRVRLELAVAYHRASQYEAALKEFTIVLDNPETPESVRLAILAYLGQLKSDQQAPESRHDFSYYIKAGLIHNSNINSTPGSGQFDFTGARVTTGSEISSLGTDITLTASHRYSKKTPLELAGAATRFEWQSQVSLESNRYEETNEFNIDVVSLSTGPAFISPGRWRSLANIRIDQIYLGNETLATFTSFNPVVTFDFGNYNGLTLEASLLSRSYDQAIDADRDGDEIIYGAGYNTLFSSLASGYEIGFRIYDNDAELDEFSYDRVEIYVGAFTSLSEHSNIYANANTQSFEYEGPEFFSGIIRDETENYLALGYNRDFRESFLKGWTMNIELALTDNDSNVDSFDYDRTLISVNWSKYIQ